MTTAAGGLTLLPDPWWPVAVMALIVLGDGLMTFRPPAVIADCLDGVGFPRDWWWTLAIVKFTATGGLIAGLWVPGLAFAAVGGLIVYFTAAAAAHLRARRLGSDFWVNCLGMLGLNLVILIACFLA